MGSGEGNWPKKKKKKKKKSKKKAVDENLSETCTVSGNIYFSLFHLGKIYFQ